MREDPERELSLQAWPRPQVEGQAVGTSKSDVWSSFQKLKGGEIMLCELSAMQYDLLFMYYFSKPGQNKEHFMVNTATKSKDNPMDSTRTSKNVCYDCISISNITEQQYDLLTHIVSDKVHTHSTESNF